MLMTSVFLSCSETIPVPKPPTHLKLDLPPQSYDKLPLDVPYSFELPQFYKAESIANRNDPSKTKNSLIVDLGPLNGKFFLYFKNLIEGDTLAKYINFANDKVDDHKVKASKILQQNIINSDKKVFGTFFELQGDVATNYQFYLTDSIRQFARGEIILNCKPNYDSLIPSLNYIKQNLLHIINTFEWKNSYDE